MKDSSALEAVTFWSPKSGNHREQRTSHLNPFDCQLTRMFLINGLIVHQLNWFYQSNLPLNRSSILWKKYAEQINPNVMGLKTAYMQFYCCWDQLTRSLLDDDRIHRILFSKRPEQYQMLKTMLMLLSREFLIGISSSSRYEYSRNRKYYCL